MSVCGAQYDLFRSTILSVSSPDTLTQIQFIKQIIMKKKTYQRPRIREGTIITSLMQLPVSQAEITRDPATEPAMAREYEESWEDFGEE